MGGIPASDEWEQIDWREIEEAAAKHLTFVHSLKHAKAVRGESSDEAYIRGLKEGFGVGYIGGLKRAGAVEVMDPVDLSNCGFAIPRDKREAEGSKA